MLARSAGAADGGRSVEGVASLCISGIIGSGLVPQGSGSGTISAHTRRGPSDKSGAGSRQPGIRA